MQFWASLVYLGLSFWLLAVVLKVEFPRLYPMGLDEGGGFAAMFFVWFIPHFFVLGLMSTAVAAWLGGLALPAGLLGLGIHLVCWGAMWRHQLQMPHRTFALDGQSLSFLALPFGEDLADPTIANSEQANRLFQQPGARGPHEFLSSLVPSLAYLTQLHPARHQVELVRNVPYFTVEGNTLRLNIYRARKAEGAGEPEGLKPCVMVIHGGAWVVGNRRQFHRTCIELAHDGFLVFAISYRLAPRFPLPAAIHDCKAAIAWIKAHASEYGGRPDFVTVIGGSAGGHLTALMALTPNDPQFQPGFEDKDTRIQAAAPLYGVMDFSSAFEENRNPLLKGILERLVVRVQHKQAPALYQAIEPLKRVNGFSPTSLFPPMLMVHGTYDRVVSPNDSRKLAQGLKAIGGSRVHLLEVPNAPHAFDVFLNPLQQRSNWVVRHFLHRTYRDFLLQTTGVPSQAATLSPSTEAIVSPSTEAKLSPATEATVAQA